MKEPSSEQKTNQPQPNADKDKNNNNNTNTTTTNNKKCGCMFKLCVKKKKKRKRSNSVSQIKYILSNNLDILQADNKKYSNNLTLLSPYRNFRNGKNRNRVSAKNANESNNNNNNNINSSNNPIDNNNNNNNQLCNVSNQQNELTIPEQHSKPPTNSNNNNNNTNNRYSLRKMNSRFGDVKNQKFFHEFKDKLRCFFCGGIKCKHENYKTNLAYNNAITGLHSNFITDDVIASQRPCQFLIEYHKLLAAFKALGIGLIVNLQREGEHPYCGPNAYNLTSTGFSYNPSVFAADNIDCKLSGWKDMSVPTSMNFMLDIVKDMSEMVRDHQKKVLVHCHAGYGRTGVVIACYMLFNSEKDSKTVIQEIRSQRRKCIETSEQRKYCRKFEEFLNHSRVLFGQKESIDEFLKRQEDLLFGEEKRKYGFVPRILIKYLEKILELKIKYNLENLVVYRILQGLIIDWNEDLEKVLTSMKMMINKNNWVLFDQTENLVILTELIFDWLEDSVDYTISQERTSEVLESEEFLTYMRTIEHNSVEHSSIINYQKGKLNTIINNNNNNSSNQNDFQSPRLSDRKLSPLTELFNCIKKTYLCFEYEILFEFATFFTMIPPKTEEEHLSFMDMLDRLCLELLGFNLADINNNSEYMEKTKPLVMGLSKIILIIFESLQDEEGKVEDFTVLSPLRKPSLYFQNKFKGPKKDPLRQGGFFVKRNNSHNVISPSCKLNSNNILSSNNNNNNPYGEFSISSSPILVKNSFSNSNQNILRNYNQMDEKEKKLFQLYNLLSNHFQNKYDTNTNTNPNNNSSSNNNNIITNNYSITLNKLGFNVRDDDIKANISLTSDNNSSCIPTPVLKAEGGKMKTQELARIIEEVFSKKSNESSSFHITNNNININNDHISEKEKDDDSSLHILDNKKDNIINKPSSPGMRKNIIDEKDESRLKIMKNNFLKKKKMFQKKYTIGVGFSQHKQFHNKDSSTNVTKPQQHNAKGNKLPITYSQIISYETFRKNIIDNKNLDINKQTSKVRQGPLNGFKSSRKLFMFHNSRLNHLQSSYADSSKNKSSCLGQDYNKKMTLYEDIKSFEQKNKIHAMPALKVRKCGWNSPSQTIKAGFSYQTSLKDQQSHRKKRDD